MAPKMDRESTRNWQPPKNDGKDNAAARQAWLQDVVRVGEDFNASLTSSRDLPRGISMISGRAQDKPSQQRSDLKIPREKRALREVVANISDIRTIDAYSSENPAYQDFLTMFNKIWKSVYFESKFQSKFKRAVQWMVPGGYSYMSPVYRNLFPSSRSARRIDFDVYSSQDCLPFQLPDDNSVQGAFAWTRIVFKPLYMGHSMFPKFQAQLKPIARRRYAGNISKDRIALAERFRNDMRTASGQAQGGNWTEQMMEFRYTTVRDLSINEGKEPKAMGAPGGLESYVVPFVGQRIPTGEVTKSLTGEIIRETRKAEEDDCYLYPNLRLFISQTGMTQPIYDGPFWDWHGMHPLVRISADEWPWEPGYALSEDIDSIGQTRANFMRGLDQTAKQRFDPAFLYDKNAGLNRKTMEQFDPYEERGRLGVDGAVDGEKVLRTALPETLMTIPEWAFAWNEKLEKTEDYLLGLDAMDNLAKAKVAGADDALLKAMEEAGPIVKDISNSCNEPVSDLMMMCLSLVLQYYPTGRMMTYTGPDGVSREVFDLDPASLVPSHAPNENPESGPSYMTRMQRCQNFCASINATIAPGELHGVVQTARKLLLIQMQRGGFMIDSETVAKAADVANWGTLDGNTVMEKWQSEQEMKLGFAVKMKELETALVGQGPTAPPTPIGVGGSKGAVGRPPSGNKPAHMETKGSATGERATITES